MKEILEITKALSDENRVRIVMMLGGGEMCVCQIIEMLGLAPSTVSKHVQILLRAGLVEMRKDGKWIYYRLAGPEASPPLRDIIQWLQEYLKDSAMITKDVERAQVVLNMDKDELCERYRKTS